MNDSLTVFTWGFASADDRAAERQAVLDSEGGELRPTPAFAEPTTLIILAAAAAVAFLADRILKFIKDARHNGLIVDCRPDGSLDIREDPSVDRGRVLVLCPPPRQVLNVSTNSEIDIVAAIKRAAGK